MKQIISIALLMLAISTATAQSNKDNLRAALTKIAAEAKGDVGIAIEGLDFQDSLSINGRKHFAMLSVYKFPLAMAVLSKGEKGKLKMNRKVLIPRLALDTATFSPMLKDYPQGDIMLYPADILYYSVSISDNNACDVLFNLVGGTAETHKYVQSLGIKGINIAATEREMKTGWEVQYTNWAEPLAMTQLLRLFYEGKKLSKESNTMLMRLMTESKNSDKRLKGLLPKDTKVAHKTGTSDKNDKGIIAAVNDVGIVTLPDGRHYAISVFVGNSKKSYEECEAVIAKISKAVWDAYSKR